ncbi:MAG: glycosyltransferase [Anaerolineaceae bacterium]|nr:glycosyltransferase [Anaerolineaceae bacterium]
MNLFSAYIQQDGGHIPQPVERRLPERKREMALSNVRGSVDRKRLLILTADAGFGHRSAANAVAAAIEEHYGDLCEVNIVNPLEDRRAPFFLRDSQSDYDKLVRRLPELYRLGYETSDAVVPAAIVEQTLTVLLFEVMRDIVRTYRPDAILTTYPLYQSPLRAVMTITRSSIPLLVSITDLATVHRLWFSSSVDLSLAPTNLVRDLALNYGLSPDQVQVTGIPVNPEVVCEKRSPVEIRLALGWKPEPITVLAVGSRRVDRLVDTLNILNHFGKPLQLAIVAGKDEKLYRELQEIEWHVPVKIYDYVENVPVLMKAADFIVCKAGGLIITEALACGRPLILIDAIPGQETGNADYVVQNGAGDLVRSTMEVLETVSHWLMDDGRILNERAENARRLGRPNAAYEVANALWLAAQRSLANVPGARGTGRLRLVDLLTRNQINLDDDPSSHVE